MFCDAVVIVHSRQRRDISVLVAGAEGVHQGVTPAVDRFQFVVGGFADGSCMGLKQSGFAEHVTMAASQVDDIVETGGGLQFLAQQLIADGAADKGLEGGERHGRRASEGICILAGQGAPGRTLQLPCRTTTLQINGEGTLLP